MTTANIAAAITKLTAEEKADWNYSFHLHQRNGWIGDDAYRRAWSDLKGQYPRLRGRKSAIRAPSLKILQTEQPAPLSWHQSADGGVYGSALRSQLNRITTRNP